MIENLTLPKSYDELYLETPVSILGCSYKDVFNNEKISTIDKKKYAETFLKVLKDNKFESICNAVTSEIDNRGARKTYINESNNIFNRFTTEY